MKIRATVLGWLVLAGLPAAEGREYQVFDVVGDSISAGVNPSCGTYGWVHMLFGQPGCGQAATDETLTNLWPGITAYNSAVSGSTARDWAWARPTYLETVSNHHPDLVVVFIGGNDGLAYAAGGYTDQEKEEFRTNLVTIIQKLRNNTPVPDIVVANYYDLFDGFSTNLPPANSNSWALSAAVVAGNQMIGEIAFSNGCFHVDVYSEFLHHTYGAELGDAGHLAPDYFRTPLAWLDIHPVTAGHDAIRQLMYDRLRELKEIPKFTEAAVADGQAVLTWRSSIGQSYVVERASAATNEYEGVATNAGAPPFNTVTNPAEGLGRAFFRIRIE